MKTKKIFVFITAMIIPMSHWHQQMVDGAEHLISCDWLVFLSAFSHLQLIQNSALSTICWCQCDIQILKGKIEIFEHQGWKLLIKERFKFLALDSWKNIIFWFNFIYFMFLLRVSCLNKNQGLSAIQNWLI